MRGESFGDILAQARQKKCWTLEEAAKELHVSVATVERWEKGLVRPQGYNLRRIGEVYDLPPEILSLHGAPALIASAISEKQRAIAMSDLTTRFQVLAASMHRSLYEVQYELRKTLEESVKDDDITRREALLRLTWLPLLGILAGNAVSIGGESINQFAAGIAACWELTRGDGHDIALAYEQINTYLPQLVGQVQVLNSTEQRKAVLTLIAQCYHFKTVIGWHAESLPAARDYARQALHYSTLADDVPLQIEVAIRLTWIHYYTKQYQQAYTEISNAVAQLKATKAPIPHLLATSAYSTFALMQAVCHQKQPALSSLGLAHEHFIVSSNDKPGCHIDYSPAGLALEDGLTHAYLGMPDKAQDSLSQITDKSPWTRVRIEAYNGQVLALLKSPNKDMEQTVTTWIAAMQGATTLRSEQRWQEAMENYSIMQALWPGERRIEELHDLAVHW
jgi:transcriptional regulator with XRE-family HTH domain/tetratricopeptide (TPR) repeat protein